MTRPRTAPSHISSLPLRIAALLGAILSMGFVTTSSASAYEQVGTFGGLTAPPKEKGVYPEYVQLGGTNGMAVNVSGAGGVPPGTIYAANSAFRVARFNPDGSFSERWQVKLEEEPYERCGPDGDPLYPHCSPYPRSSTGDRVDVDVDQTTGNVYVLIRNDPGNQAIAEYSPDGSEVIARFGEVIGSSSGKKTVETPDGIHASGDGGIAVNDAGEVYVFDSNNQGYEAGSTRSYHRLMVFKPQTPGDYEHYVYAGLDHDLATGEEVLHEFPARPVTDAAGDVYVAPEEGIEKYDPAQPGSPPVCKFKFKKGAIRAVTVDRKSGEVFFTTSADTKIHRLSACNEGKFTEIEAIEVSPKLETIYALAFDPERHFDSDRAAGVLYAAAPSVNAGEQLELDLTGLGYVLAPPKELAPSVSAQSADSITSGSARLGATVNPNGSATAYAFQYLPDAAYRANEPDERQSLSLSATGGVFGLSFQGAALGGQATADLTSGSNLATALRTATGTADLSAATGSATLNGAKGTGTAIAGSSAITSLNTTEGSFEVGQGINGPGIPGGTTITAIEPETPLSTLELKISSPATASSAHLEIRSGSDLLTSLNTAEGAFEVDQQISGAGISGNTTIAGVTPTTLTLSNPVSAPGTGVALKAGSVTLTGLASGIGHFEVGQQIEGEGIPAGTTIKAVGPTSLTVSNPVTKAGSDVAIAQTGPAPLAVGEQVEGPGIAPGTEILATEAGQLTLSSPATASGSAVLLRAGLAADIPAPRLREALSALPSIGAGNVEVSGGPDEAGPSPYLISFTGALGNADLPQLSVDPAGLSGGSATIGTEHDGGAGFESGASEAPLEAIPLEGSAALPVAATLNGPVEAVARIDSKNGGIRTSFSTIPDAPLTKVVVQMQGAKKGLIVNSTDICAGTHKAEASFAGHNGKSAKRSPEVGANCGKKKGGRK